jgi:hypothetical protein
MSIAADTSNDRGDHRQWAASKRLHLVFGRGWCEARGFKARELLIDVGARPVWGSRRRSWSVSAAHGRDACALAEMRGYLVEISEVAS